MTDTGQTCRAGPVSDAPSPQEILAEVERICASPAFDAPERSRKFLTYIVQESLAGRADRIKAYSIATEVFGRDSSFDAQSDPVVRIEAGRIRRSLERYYLLDGQDGTLVITIPKGGYVPVFERKAPGMAPHEARYPDSVPAAGAGWRMRSLAKPLNLAVAALCSLGAIAAVIWIVAGPLQPSGSPTLPKLVIMPFEDASDTPFSRIIAQGIADEIVTGIARFRDITVVVDKTAPGGKPPQQAHTGPNVFELEGRVRLDGQQLRFGVRVVRQSDRAVVWAASYDEQLQPDKIIDLQERAATAVATAIGQPFGVVFRANAPQVSAAVPDEWGAYACKLAYHGYRSNPSPDTNGMVRSCLRKATLRYPGDSLGWALLALTYVDEFRYRYRPENASEDPISVAGTMASRALQLDPRNVRAMQAQMLILFFTGNIDAALAVGARAYDINPNDTELVGEYGFRLALSGQWDSGCRMVSDTISRNLGPQGYFEAAMAVCAFIAHDYAAAERWARVSDLEANPIYHVILLAILGELGKTDEIAKERQWLARHAPAMLDNIREEVALRFGRPEDQQCFLASLRKAGLSIPTEAEPGADHSPAY